VLWHLLDAVSFCQFEIHNSINIRLEFECKYIKNQDLHIPLNGWLLALIHNQHIITLKNYALFSILILSYWKIVLFFATPKMEGQQAQNPGLVLQVFRKYSLVLIR